MYRMARRAPARAGPPSFRRGSLLSRDRNGRSTAWWQERSLSVRAGVRRKSASKPRRILSQVSRSRGC